MSIEKLLKGKLSVRRWVEAETHDREERSYNRGYIRAIEDVKEQIDKEFNNIRSILDMIHHYYIMKGILDIEMLEKALLLVSRGKNPFINDKFIEQMKKRKKPNYILSHEVFQIRLRNDEK